MVKNNKTIGIIGLGSIGMRHKENLWKHLKQTEVIGYDPDAAKTNGAGWVIGDVDQMIDMCDAVVIASPTSMHKEHIFKCFGEAMSCFVEKPIADQMIDIEGTNNIVMVGYNLRFHSCVLVAKDWISSGALGDLLWANFTLGQHSEKSPYLRDGVILNWSHEIDLALYLLGRGSVSGSSTRLSDGRDDLTDILLTHENGCRSTVHLDYLTETEVRQFIIVGSEATIIADLLQRHAWLRGKDGNIIDQHQGHDDWNDNYIEEMQAFLDRLDGKETLGCTAEEGLDVLKICLEVRKQAGL